MNLEQKYNSYMFIMIVCFMFIGLVACTPSGVESTFEQMNPLQEIEPTETPALGILESGIFFEAHVPRHVRIENIWQGYMNDNLMRVYVGQYKPETRTAASIEPEGQFGALYVMTFWPDGKVETNLHITSEETGPLRIQEATEEFLIIGSTGTEKLAGELPQKKCYPKIGR